MTYTPSASSWLVTNAAGDEVAFYGYDAFGNLAFGTPTSQFGYGGQYTDPSSTFSNMRARWYEPETGNFTTRDPAFASTGTAYTYAGDDPVNTNDPTGLGLLSDVVDTFDPWSHNNAFYKLGYKHPKGAAKVFSAVSSTSGLVTAILPNPFTAVISVGAGAFATAMDAENGSTSSAIMDAIGTALNVLGYGATTIAGSLAESAAAESQFVDDFLHGLSSMSGYWTDSLSAASNAFRLLAGTLDAASLISILGQYGVLGLTSFGSSCGG
ncbi:MAG: RHS repeat-associated core domain-containing protein [Acidimicrobiales bacterium]|jgi:RHS repeat-associated protein